MISHSPSIFHVYMYVYIYMYIEKVGGCTGLTAISFFPLVLGKQTTVWPAPL